MQRQNSPGKRCPHPTVLRTTPFFLKASFDLPPDAITNEKNESTQKQLSKAKVSKLVFLEKHIYNWVQYIGQQMQTLKKVKEETVVEIIANHNG